MEIIGRVGYLTAIVEDAVGLPAAISYMRNLVIGGDTPYAYAAHPREPPLRTSPASRPGQSVEVWLARLPLRERRVGLGEARRLLRNSGAVV